MLCNSGRCTFVQFQLYVSFLCRNLRLQQLGTYAFRRMCSITLCAKTLWKSSCRLSMKMVNTRSRDYCSLHHFENMFPASEKKRPQHCRGFHHANVHMGTPVASPIRSVIATLESHSLESCQFHPEGLVSEWISLRKKIRLEVAFCVIVKNDNRRVRTWGPIDRVLLCKQVR